MAAELRELLDGETPSRESLTDQAYRAIRQAISDLTIRPGEPIAENTLARWLGMSRTPVREAILRLRQERWVHSIPRKGLYVSPVSITDLREIYEALEGLEMVIVRLVAERASDADVARIGECVERMEAALAADDRPAWSEADLDFHGLLAELAGNQRIREIRDRFWDQLDRVHRILLWLRALPTASTEEHRALYEAIRRRDADAAAALARAHRARAREEFITLLTEQAPGLVAI